MNERVLYDSGDVNFSFSSNGHIKYLLNVWKPPIGRFVGYDFLKREIDEILSLNDGKLEHRLYEIHGSLLASLFNIGIGDVKDIRKIFESTSKAL